MGSASRDTLTRQHHTLPHATTRYNTRYHTTHHHTTSHTTLHHSDDRRTPHPLLQGSFGRIILPAASGVIAQYAGNDTLFICIAVVLGLTWAFVVYFYEVFTRLTL